MFDSEAERRPTQRGFSSTRDIDYHARRFSKLDKHVLEFVETSVEESLADSLASLKLSCDLCWLGGKTGRSCERF